MHKSLRTRLWTGGVTLIGVVSFFYPFVNPPRSPVLSSPEQAVIVKQPVPDFSSYRQVVDKKRAFFAYLLPEVQKQNQRILVQRNLILALYDQWQRDGSASINSIQQTQLHAIASSYRIDTALINQTFFEKLLARVDVIPHELVLVQAANESAWGTSRFAREGYNFFGMWCFTKGCGFVPLRREQDMEHEVEKFSSLSQGVAKYMNTLNRHFAYEDLRYIRSVFRMTQQPVTAELLAEGLLHYSERGQAYVEELQAMIRINRKYMQVKQEAELAKS